MFTKHIQIVRIAVLLFCLLLPLSACSSEKTPANLLADSIADESAMVGTSIPLVLDETEDLISDTTSTTVTAPEKDEEKATVTGDETLATIPSASLTPSTTEPSASSAISATTTAAPTDPTLPSQPTDKTSLGVWWWDIGLIKGSTGERYLDFLEDNDVTEIYLCIDGMQSTGGTASYADVRAFVRQSRSRGIRVAALTGEVTWINPGNNGFQAYVDKVREYQAEASEEEKFYGMHLDVEPHQHGSFSSKRATVMQWFADFMLGKAAPAASATGMLLEWDIPFWLEDTVKDPEGKSADLLELMAKTCDTLTVMSYRDTVEGMYDISVEEIAAAKKYGCKIVLGAECVSSEGDQVSYQEEGKAVMAAELNKLAKRLAADVGSGNYGLAVHHITTWYSLKD